MWNAKDSYWNANTESSMHYKQCLVMLDITKRFRGKHLHQLSHLQKLSLVILVKAKQMRKKSPA